MSKQIDTLRHSKRLTWGKYPLLFKVIYIHKRVMALSALQDFTQCHA